MGTGTGLVDGTWRFALKALTREETFACEQPRSILHIGARHSRNHYEPGFREEHSPRSALIRQRLRQPGDIIERQWMKLAALQLSPNMASIPTTFRLALVTLIEVVLENESH